MEKERLVKFIIENTNVDLSEKMANEIENNNDLYNEFISTFYYLAIENWQSNPENCYYQ